MYRGVGGRASGVGFYSRWEDGHYFFLSFSLPPNTLPSRLLPCYKFSQQHYSDRQTSDEFIVLFVELVTDDQTSGTEYPRPPPSGYLTQ